MCKSLACIIASNYHSKILGALIANMISMDIFRCLTRPIERGSANLEAQRGVCVLLLFLLRQIQKFLLQMLEKISR